VHIKRLMKSGQLSEVGQVTNLGSRIRNARVLGSIKFHPSTPEGLNGNGKASFARAESGISEKQSRPQNQEPEQPVFRKQAPDPNAQLDIDAPATPADKIRLDDSYADISMLSVSKGQEFQLGPQMISLVLETGDLVFLLAADLGPGTVLQPFLSRYPAGKSLLNEQPGTHLTADPSSRYLALACSENVISIYALRSSQEIGAQYASGRSFSCVKEERFLQVKGVILKMEFLFPSPSDPDHIILLLLIVRKGKTRMSLYEWVAGQSLSDIRQNNKKGHLLDDSYRIPLLLIPLTIRSSFLLICEESIAVCEGLLEGEPRCRPSPIATEEPSPLHKGSNPPLWTSWTRPIRIPRYAATHDDIYLAREDGLVKYLESNYEEILSPEMNVDGINCNIGTAFASLDSKFPGADGAMGDILVIGGDSGPGGLYWVCILDLPALLFY